MRQRVLQQIKLVAVSSLFYFLLTVIFSFARAHGQDVGDHLGPAPAANINANVSGDHRAQIFNFKGDVRSLKKGLDQWTMIQKGQGIEAGDQILTGKASTLDIAYDRYYLNIARIDENTRAEFISIEPTVVRLEDGTIFSVLDALKPGSKYEIATPTAVAAVRGTHFVTSFDAAVRGFACATLSVNDGHESYIDVLDPKSGTSVPVPEGNQLKWDLTSALNQMIQTPISQELIEGTEKDLGEMGQVENFEALREDGTKRGQAPTR